MILVNIDSEQKLPLGTFYEKKYTFSLVFCMTIANLDPQDDHEFLL